VSSTSLHRSRDPCQDYETTPAWRGRAHLPARGRRP